MIRELLGKMGRVAQAAEVPSAGSTRHAEIELKFAADHVSHEAFAKWGRGLKVIEESSNAGDDFFFRRGNDVLRHRVGGIHELTTKIKTSKTSTLDRVEVDAHQASPPEDVQALLRLVGFKDELAVGKTTPHSFDVRDPVSGKNVKVNISMYDAYKVGDEQKVKRFIEAEVEKNPEISKEEAEEIVNRWKTELQKQFGVGEPMSKSLYEVFGGKGYRREGELNWQKPAAIAAGLAALSGTSAWVGSKLGGDGQQEPAQLHHAPAAPAAPAAPTAAAPAEVDWEHL